MGIHECRCEMCEQGFIWFSGAPFSSVCPDCAGKTVDQPRPREFLYVGRFISTHGTEYSILEPSPYVEGADKFALIEKSAYDAVVKERDALAAEKIAQSLRAPHGQCPTCQRVLGLTKRQWVTANYLYDGLVVKEIAAKENLSVRAARSAVERLRITLGLVHSTRGELVLAIGDLKRKRLDLDKT